MEKLKEKQSVIICDKTCSGCFYFQGNSEKVRFCNYYLITGKRRPCPAGHGCTVRKIKRKKRG